MTKREFVERFLLRLADQIAAVSSCNVDNDYLAARLNDMIESAERAWAAIGRALPPADSRPRQ